jgi:RNA polymerase sigma-70 factor, ECF subfamily
MNGPAPMLQPKTSPMPNVDAPALMLGALATLRPAERRWSPDPASAEDLLYDTLERALRRLDRFQIGTCAMAWLATIMYRLAIDARRREGRDSRLRASYRAEVTTVACDAEDDGAPAAPRAGDDLRAMAEMLDEPFRSTFVMWALENLSYREISRRTGKPIGTVATRLLRARTVLRAQLGDRR